MANARCRVRESSRYASTLFADVHDKPRAHAYLTLPISPLERWAVRLLMSTIGYAVLALVGYFLVTLLGAGVSQRSPWARRFSSGRSFAPLFWFLTYRRLGEAEV